MLTKTLRWTSKMLETLLDVEDEKVFARYAIIQSRVAKHLADFEKMERGFSLKENHDIVSDLDMESKEQKKLLILLKEAGETRQIMIRKIQNEKRSKSVARSDFAPEEGRPHHGHLVRREPIRKRSS